MNLSRLGWRISFEYVALFLIIGVTQCFAIQSPFSNTKSTKVDADPKKDYFLQESDGNWFAMVKKFSGNNAPLQAKRLAYELRAAYKMPAFVFKYDPDQEDMDALSKQLGKHKKFHYQTSRAVEYAVLVGGYPTGEDLELQKTLEKIRKMQPKSLKDDPQSKATAERFKISAKTDSQYVGYGPLGGAIPVPNPLLPPEFFNRKGVVDPFVAKLNSDSKYSLLNNKKTYTVRIATFSGDTSIKKSSESFGELETRLQYAGLRAAALCEALRNQGVEAWEFHDRDCSFVTIGSFDQYGTLQADGHTELNPQVGEIMKKYGGSLVDGEDGRSRYRAYTIVVEIPDPNSSALAPKKKKLTIACDVRPVIIVVPQRSGEENVRKIALATKQMDQAKRQILENAVERSLKEAENNLESAKQFASANGHALTEEEYLAWASKMSPQASKSTSKTKQTPQAASTQVRYTAKAQQPSSGNVAGITPQASQITQTPSTSNQGVSSNNGKTGIASNQRPYRTNTVRQTKTAQKNVAPTY